MLDVKDRVAVVTGASRGLGAGLAEAFAARGLRLGLCARGAAVLPSGDRVHTERVDVTDEAAVEAFAGAVSERFGAIDLWINNAGVLDPIGPLRDVALSDFEAHLKVNVSGVFLGTRAYVRHLRRVARPGVLINVSSGAARRPYPGWSTYCAAKAAVDRMTECVALEEEEIGLRAYSVAPGVIDTDMQAAIRAASERDFPQRERFVQLKRDDAFSTPAFVAERLLEVAFDPGMRPDRVLLRLPEQHAAG